ncbi:U3 small nucleolar RNA-associated protein 11 [Lindgomyces ingoldianus]|uniref:U3 small nucleolar RNA-associated protein 11 n=1 Tax=Lindgomyces ingoldianus TaxID=673940 RepID=A0ACB6R9X1_9PLEO|nr:U3 small nucleolar RNA-associated protein 11 [Lindgomyces ingoldianus]KAF2476118.1 U3 small nucleolar RNA-associated protein 11 [Lindgomyces ingoldianus]
MSSMRNAVQRRNHKERAQPLEREKWGLLEKHKDYKLRATDHKEKRKRLKILKQKATERNPDEFSFAMLSSTVDKVGRRVADRGNKALSTDVVKLLKTQDVGYIRTMLQVVRKERAELEERIVLEGDEVRLLRDGDEGASGSHTVFVADRDAQKGFEAEEWFGTGQDRVGRVWNRPRKEKETSKELDGDAEVLQKKPSKKQQEAKDLARKEERAFLKRRERTQARIAGHLEAVKARERDLMIAEEELEKQRAKMNGTIGGVNKHGVKGTQQHIPQLMD